MDLLEHDAHNNDPKFRLEWEPVVPSGYGDAGIDWDPLEVTEAWKIYSDRLEFAHKYSLPRLVDHCELLLMDSLYYREINALSYVIRASGKKVFENMHKLGMFKVLSEFPQHISSPAWMKLTETEILFIRDNYHHFKLATKLRVWTAIQVWCSGTMNDASEAREKFNRIRLNN